MRPKLRRYPHSRGRIKLNTWAIYLLSPGALRYPHNMDMSKKTINKTSFFPKEQTFGAFSRKAGITLEASMTLPLVLLILALFLSFFSAQVWQLRLQKALDEIGEDIAVWSYLLDFADDYSQTNLLSLTDGSKISMALGGSEEALQELMQEENDWLGDIRFLLKEKASALVWQQMVRTWLIGKVGRDRLEGSRIQKGAMGLSLSGSTLHSRDLDLVLSYRIVPLFGELLGISTPVVQRSCRRLWIGTPVEKEEQEEEKEEKEEEPTVYVTENGRAYHGSQSCRVFKINPLLVLLSSVKELRNEEGSKYYACERCALGRDKQDLVWLTDFGNRYHHEQDCPSLKRMIIPLSLSEAKEKYKACGFCGGSHE